MISLLLLRETVLFRLLALVLFKKKKKKSRDDGLALNWCDAAGWKEGSFCVCAEQLLVGRPVPCCCADLGMVYKGWQEGKARVLWLSSCRSVSATLCNLLVKPPRIPMSFPRKQEGGEPQRTASCSHTSGRCTSPAGKNTPSLLGRHVGCRCTASKSKSGLMPVWTGL